MAFLCASVCLFVGAAMLPIPALAADQDGDKQYVQNELELYNVLLDSSRYNSELIPLRNNSDDRIRLFIGIFPIQLVEVDERSNQVEMNIWLKMRWKDFLLTWDPQGYNGIKQIRLPYSSVWRADLEVFNDAFHAANEEKANKLVVVESDGTVTWINQEKVRVVCNFNLRHFPFDSHDCEIKIGSWTYTTNEIYTAFDDEGRKGQMQLELLDGHPEWHFESKGGKKNIKSYGCCSEYYADLTFKFKLSRQVAYYQCVFIAPAIMLAMLIPMLFILGPGNKFALGAGMIVSLSIFMEALEERVPVAHASIPIIAQYYMGLFAFISLALVISSLTANLAERANYRKPPPYILQSIFLGRLATLLCVKTEDYISVEPVSTVSMGGLDFKDDESITDFDRQQVLPSRPASYGQRGQWRAIAATLDRIFFIITIVCLVIFSIVVSSH